MGTTRIALLWGMLAMCFTTEAENSTRCSAATGLCAAASHDNVPTGSHAFDVRFYRPSPNRYPRGHRPRPYPYHSDTYGRLPGNHNKGYDGGTAPFVHGGRSRGGRGGGRVGSGGGGVLGTSYLLHRGPYFGEIPHGRILISYRRFRMQHGLPSPLLGSIRKGFHFFRDENVGHIFGYY